MKLVLETPTQFFLYVYYWQFKNILGRFLKNVLIMKLYKFSHNSYSSQYPEGEEKVLCNEFVVTTSVVRFLPLVIDHNRGYKS